jgi:hypothetical protein
MKVYLLVLILFLIGLTWFMLRKSKEMYRPTFVLTKDGRRAMGQVVREDSYNVDPEATGVQMALWGPYLVDNSKETIQSMYRLLGIPPQDLTI